METAILLIVAAVIGFVPTVAILFLATVHVTCLSVEKINKSQVRNINLEHGLDKRFQHLYD